MAENYKKLEEKTPKKLGLSGRALLMVAALTKGISGIIREDSRKSRAAFWGYAAAGAVLAPMSIALIILPGPNVLGIGLVLASGFVFAGGIKALAATGLSRWAQERNETHLKNVFNSAALVKRYDAYIQPKEGMPGAYTIRKKALLTDTFNRAGAHLSDVSPLPMRKVATFMINNLTKAGASIASVFNRVAGKAPPPPEDKAQAREENPRSQDEAPKPPKPPGA